FQAEDGIRDYKVTGVQTCALPILNCLALEAALERKGQPARTLSAFVMPEVCELYTRATAFKYLAEGRIVLLGGGTGNPFFTTDRSEERRVGKECRSRRAPVH